MKNLRSCSIWTLVVLLLLGASFVVQAQIVNATKQAAKGAKISPDLYRVMQNNGPVAPASIGGVTVETNQVIVGDKIAIEAVANNDDGEGLLNQLKALGLTDGVAYKRKIFGYLPIDKIGELKNVSSLGYADAFYKPETNTGSVTSQGDAALKADVARTTYGVTGAGVKVGILSDSYNRLGGQAAGIASNDLPAAGVQVLAEGPSGADEGRAMAEIIYDVAPGSPLAFNTAFTGEAGFAQGIINLATMAGCQIIVDDVGYLNAPMFQDGIVAQAVNQVVNNNGVTYFSAAANQARSSYQAPYKGGSTFMGSPVHNFAASGTDALQQITIPTNGTLRLAFQWDNPYPSVTGVANSTATSTDLDIYIFNAAGTTILASSERDQSTGTADPWEITGTVSNTTGAPLNVNVVIAKFSGPDPGLIKWVNYGSRTIINEYDTKSSTSFGHANAAGAIAVGATAYFQTPVFNGASTATIEGFSSAGGTPILFNMNGSRINGITGTVRQKPEITSVDGGDNTFFGQDYEPNGRPNFFGTSAAAPHAAGVAALMKQKVPAITRNTILSTLENTALDMDDPSTAGFDAGFDFGTGYGFIQADKALQAISPSSLSLVVSANPTVILTTGTTTLSATVSGGTTPYSYTFSGPGTIIPSGNTASVSGLSAGVQTFTVVARDATAPTSQSISGTVSVTVNMAPPANTPPTVANPVSPQSATVGIAYTLSLANVFTDAETPSSLTLSVSGLPAGLSFSPPSTISGTPSLSGLSSVTVVATDPGSLTASNTFTITVSPAPVVVTPLALTFTANPTVILTTGTTTLSATVSGGTTPYSYTFSGPGTITSSGNTASVSGLSAGVQTFTVVARDATAPISQSISGTVSVTVNMAPPATFSITGVTTVSCETISAGQRRVTFNPGYAGLDGTPVSFSVANEMTPTTNPGPYVLNLYTDNPVITLQALQSGASSSFAYNWLSACSSSTGNTPPTVANPVPPQSATVGIAYTLSLANVFTDAETPSSLVLSVMGLPAGLNFVAPSTISGTPSMSGVSTVTVTATDPGGMMASTSFTITVNPAAGTPPPPSGTFSITSVQTISCQVLSAGERRLTFNPQYAGVNGAPISFSVVSEMLPTTAPGPYSLDLYTDNPVVTLQAVQSGISSSFAYNWLAACSSSTANTPPTVANPVSPQSATVGVGYTLSLANVFTDAETPNQLTLSVSGLPAGLNFVAPSTISGTPSMSGVSSVTVTATDPGGMMASTSFTLTVNPAGGTPPPTGTFSITGVTTVSCQVISAGQRQVSFTPQYAGVDGSPVSFSVVNEMLPTTNPGPYTLNLYTDNPTITLSAVQSGVSSTFAYNWLSACTPAAPSARVGAGSELTTKLRATILPNPVSDEFRIRLEGLQGQVVRLELSDVSGHSLLNRSVDVVSDDHQESVRFNQPGRGLYLLRVSTGQQVVTLKVIRE